MKKTSPEWQAEPETQKKDAETISGFFAMLVWSVSAVSHMLRWTVGCKGQLPRSWFVC
jgi:hypothetical protein